MTPKQRLLAVLAGETPDKVPFAPFSELIPRSQFELEFRNRGMGLIQHHSSVYQSNSTPVVTEHQGKKTIITIKTPFGDLTEVHEHVKGVSNSGSVQTGFYIKDAEDYPKILSHLRNTEILIDPGDDEKIDFYLGDEGITHVWADEPPYMATQYMLGLENWAYHQVDYPEKFAALLDCLEEIQERRMNLIAQSNQNLINLGNLAGNFSPADFERYMLPHFQKYSMLLRQAGKYSTIHADASNLKCHSDLLVRCGVDVIEAFTPPPIGDLSISELRRIIGEKVTIHINFPETIFYSGYDATYRYTIDLLKEDPCPNKIIGITEMGFAGATARNVRTIYNGFRAIMDAIDEAGRY